MFLLFLVCVLHPAFADPGSPQIIGGRNANKGELPYQVSVRDRSFLGNYNHKCGGVIIGSQDILTAAQCVRNAKPADIYVVAGTNLLDVGSDRNAIVANAEKITIHPSFNNDRLTYNDIAIIRLKERFPDRADVKAATLLSTVPSNGASCTVSGWGVIVDTAQMETKVSYTLRVANLFYLRNADCSARLPALHNDEVCSEPNGNVPTGACDQDNGGPFICDGGLLGIYSWSQTRCGTSSSPGVFASVPYHLEWITKNSEVPRTTSKSPGNTTTPKGGGSTTKPPPFQPGNTETCLILGIIQVIMICVVLLVLFVVIAIARK